jgi:hypothetical protein
MDMPKRRIKMSDEKLVKASALVDAMAGAMEHLINEYNKLDDRSKMMAFNKIDDMRNEIQNDIRSFRMSMSKGES